MEFTFTTHYDIETMVLMSRAVRKTARKKSTIIRYFFLTVIFILCVILTSPVAAGKLPLAGPVILVWVVLVMLVLSLVFEDQLNGRLGAARALVRNDTVRASFTPEGYVTESTMGRTEWSYDKVLYIAESENYIILLLSTNHGQAYDKRTMTGGSIEAFRGLLKEWTEKDRITKV